MMKRFLPILIALLLLVNSACAVKATDLKRYFHGKNGYPSYYYHKKTKQKYIGVKVKKKTVYAAVFNPDGTPQIYIKKK